MKQISLALLCLLSTVIITPTSGQSAFGIKAVISHPITTSESIMLAGSDRYINNTLNYQSTQKVLGFGATYYKAFTRVWIEGSLLYSQKESSYDLDSYTGLGKQVLHDKVSEITVPLTAGIYIAKSMRIGFGPTFRKIIDHSRALMIDPLFAPSNRTCDNGFHFVFGINLTEHIHIDLQFEQGFNRNGEAYTYNDEALEYQFRKRYASIALKFLLGK